MEVSKLTKIEQAPETGRYLIYTREKVFFDDYQTINEVREIIENKEVLEIHMFDESKEYRMIVTESKRYPEGVIEYVISSKEEDTFIDQTVINEDDASTLEVINYIAYSENSGMAYISDYRLRMRRSSNGK